MTNARLPQQHATTGKFVRTPEQIAQDRRAADLRSLGYTYQMIGDRLDVDISTAHRMVNRAMAESPVEGATHVRQIELEKIDRVERYYQSVLQNPPAKVGNTGKVVMTFEVNEETGEVEEIPMIDEAARMDAAGGILKAQAQRAKLLGLNAPTVTRGEVVVYDIESDTARMIEAQTKALEAMGLNDRVNEFRNYFVSALGGGENQVGDANAIEAVVVSESSV